MEEPHLGLMPQKALQIIYILKCITLKNGMWGWRLRGFWYKNEVEILQAIYYQRFFNKQIVRLILFHITFRTSTCTYDISSVLINFENQSALEH